MVTTRMLMRSPRRTALVVAAVGLVVLALPLAWYLASPLFLTQAVSESAPAAPAQSRLAAGRFGVVDGIHKGEGAATLVRLPDGQTCAAPRRRLPRHQRTRPVRLSVRRRGSAKQVPTCTQPVRSR